MTHKEVKDFARRVERLCDFFISKGKEEGSPSDDLRIIMDLKDEAADIQFSTDLKVGFEGLERYMKGIPEPQEA
jgi:hypothetical protein